MPQEDDDDDDDEEEEEEELEDMDIDSPLQYISHASARQSDPRTPKAGSSRSRPVSRTTNDVYDTIPSPHRQFTRSGVGR
ncbi:hypothetical protein MPER_13963 [Moniliophthora perniciosa FA553]|nr:hypothetical protein MPER_13963 [Moniliophthora perniciosa FA553]